MAAVECQVLRSQLCTILMLFYQKGSFRAQNLEPFRGSLVLTEVIHCNFIFRFSLLFATSEWYVKFISRKIIIMDRKSELLSNQLWKKAVCTRAWSMGCQTPSLFHLYFSNYKMFFCFISQSVRGQIAKKSGAQRLFFFFPGWSLLQKSDFMSWKQNKERKITSRWSNGLANHWIFSSKNHTNRNTSCLKKWHSDKLWGEQMLRVYKWWGWSDDID